MRLATTALLVLVCSNAQALAQTATIEPSVEAPKIAATRAPAPQSVNVLNFPDLQLVSGTVDIGNLPLDADGAVRVTSAPARQMAWIELVPEPLLMECNGANIDITFPTIIDTTGYTKIGIYAPDNGFGSGFIQLSWQWADDEPFEGVLDWTTTGSGIACAPRTGARYLCPNMGGKLKIRCSWSLANCESTGMLYSLRVYLIP